MEYQRLQPIAPLQSNSAKRRPNSEAAYWTSFRRPVFVKEFAPVTSIHFVPQPSSHAVRAVAASSSSSSSSRVGAAAGDAATQADAGASSSSAAPSSALASVAMPSSAGFSATSTERMRFAVTTGSRVQLYSTRNTRVVKTLSRFNDVARSANVRADGKLIVAGDDSGLIQVFDVNSRAVLRTLKGHELAVHVTKFSSNPTEIVSASDDHTVRIWDMPSQSCSRVLRGHTDYVRSASVGVDNANLVLSGSYDGTVRLWDTRTAERGGCAMEMRHGGQPVEDCLVFPTGGGGVALSVGGPVLRAWDLMMGGRCTRAVSNHTKTITSLAVSLSSGVDATASGGLGGGVRVLTAGLDQLVKVYDPERHYRVTHTMRYPAAVLSLAVSPDEAHLAVGMADGTLCVRRREVRAAEAQHRQRQREALGAGAYEYLREGGGVGGGQGRPHALDDVRVEAVRSRRLRPYDRLLKAFRYREALDESLRKGVPAAVTFALLAELRDRSSFGADDDDAGGGGGGGGARGGAGAAAGGASGQESALRRAVAGRDDVTLEPLLRFLLRHATDVQHVRLVCETMHVVIDTYAPVLGQSPLVDDVFGRLWAKVMDEVRLRRELTEVRGALEMLLTSSALRV